MKAERERFDPMNLSIFVKTSLDSVIDVFAFILPLYHQAKMGSLPGLCRKAHSRPCDLLALIPVCSSAQPNGQPARKGGSGQCLDGMEHYFCKSEADSIQMGRASS